MSPRPQDSNLAFIPASDMSPDSLNKSELLKKYNGRSQTSGKVSD